MRTLAVLGTVAALGLAVAGLGTSAPSQTELTGKCAKANLDLFTDGKLTLATDNLSFPPWWGGKGGHGFDPSDPYSGKGYEGAVSYEIARRLGFAKSEVTWKPVGFNKAIAPGKKAYDAYISQVSYNPARAKVFDFSISYYFVNQAVVGLKGTPITKVKTLKGLKPFTLGAPVATTSYNYIVRYIKPVPKPKVYDSVNDTIAALKAKQIDGVRRRLSQHGIHHGRPTTHLDGRRPPAHAGHEGTVRAHLQEGQLARHLRQQGAYRDAGGRNAEAIRVEVACGHCADPEVATP